MVFQDKNQRNGTSSSTASNSLLSEESKSSTEKFEKKLCLRKGLVFPLLALFILALTLRRRETGFPARGSVLVQHDSSHDASGSQQEGPGDGVANSNAAAFVAQDSGLESRQMRPGGAPSPGGAQDHLRSRQARKKELRGTGAQKKDGKKRKENIFPSCKRFLGRIKAGCADFWSREFFFSWWGFRHYCFFLSTFLVLWNRGVVIFDSLVSEKEVDSSTWRNEFLESVLWGFYGKPWLPKRWLGNALVGVFSENLVNSFYGKNDDSFEISTGIFDKITDEIVEIWMFWMRVRWYVVQVVGLPFLHLWYVWRGLKKAQQGGNAEREW